MQAVQIDSTEYFELSPGKTLDIQINYPVTYRSKMVLVGYEIGKYIILKYPKTARPNELQDVLVEGNGVIVRYLLEGQSGKCFAFRSAINHIVQKPERLIFLSYPETIENRELRKQRRQVTHIPASISISSQDEAQTDSEIQGIISDINVNGCGFSFPTENKNVKVNQRDVFVNIHNPVTGIEKVAARVCNSRNENGRVSVGIKFVNAKEQVDSLLSSLQIAVA